MERGEIFERFIRECHSWQDTLRVTGKGAAARGDQAPDTASPIAAYEKKRRRQRLKDLEEKEARINCFYTNLETEAQAFWPVYEEYQKALEKLDTLTGKLIEDYARNFQDMSDMVAKTIVDDHLAIEMERAKLMQSYLPKLRQVLPERKVARYYQIENKIKAVANFEIARNIPLFK